MNEPKSRGSDKLGALTPDALHKSLGLARGSYTIKRWWKYGQPKIDLVRATLDISDPNKAGEVIAGLIKQHGNGMQITIEGFPYGIPKLDGVGLKVRMDTWSEG